MINLLQLQSVPTSVHESYIAAVLTHTTYAGTVLPTRVYAERLTGLLAEYGLGIYQVDQVETALMFYKGSVDLLVAVPEYKSVPARFQQLLDQAVAGSTGSTSTGESTCIVLLVTLAAATAGSHVPCNALPPAGMKHNARVRMVA